MRAFLVVSPLALLPEALEVVLWIVAAPLAVLLVALLLGVRRIPNDRVGVVEKLWSFRGSVQHGLLALHGEAGYQRLVLRGGLHVGLFPWQSRVHVLPLVSVSQGKLAYVYARDGQALPPEQTLGRVVACDHFQDAVAFLRGSAQGGAGQRGRQRAILREGLYAINLALFVVITEEAVYRLGIGDEGERRSVDRWQKELGGIDGFSPVVIGGRGGDPDSAADEIGIVTTQDGPPLPAGEVIAPAVVAQDAAGVERDRFQDIEAFLREGGRRGRQAVPLVDGTYFLNRWFASVECIPKTVVPIGYVGVVVSYHGKAGADLSGVSFRHGERAAEGGRGVLERTLGPGKYPFNTYAGQVHLVPTTNFVLHWITGRTESHRYDETLKSIDLVTADAYEPVLPLSVVVHIDYERAPSVVQRFGDVQRLITQTLDPLLSAYFRDIAHKKTMLQLLHERDLIQREATLALRARFTEFDIQLVDVLIGKPDSVCGDTKIETLLEQLRLRQLSKEQVETYEQQRLAAERLKTLRLAEAVASKQTELTHSQVGIEIATNQGNADLARARLGAEQTVVTADAESRRSVLLAEGRGRERVLVGEGEAKRRTLRGEAQAGVIRAQAAALGDSNLYALLALARQLASSAQPVVPERVFLGGGRDSGASVSTTLGPLAALFDLVHDRVQAGSRKPRDAEGSTPPPEGT